MNKLLIAQKYQSKLSRSLSQWSLFPTGFISRKKINNTVQEANKMFLMEQNEIVADLLEDN